MKLNLTKCFTIDDGFFPLSISGKLYAYFRIIEGSSRLTDFIEVGKISHTLVQFKPIPLTVRFLTSKNRKYYPTDLVLSKKHPYVICVAQDRMFVYDRNKDQVIHEVDLPEQSCRKICMTYDNQYLFTSGEDLVLHGYNIKDFKIEIELSTKQHLDDLGENNEMDILVCSPVENIICAGYDQNEEYGEGMICFFDYQRKEIINRLHRPAQRWIEDIVFSLKYSELVFIVDNPQGVLSENAEIIAYNWRTGAKVSLVQYQTKNPYIFDIAISSDGELLSVIFVSDQRSYPYQYELQIFDISKFHLNNLEFELIFDMFNDDLGMFGKFSLDKKYFFTGDSIVDSPSDKPITVWELNFE